MNGRPKPTLLGEITLSGLLVGLFESEKYKGKVQVIMFADKNSFKALLNFEKNGIKKGTLFNRPYVEIDSKDYGEELSNKYVAKVSASTKYEYLRFIDVYYKRINSSKFERGVKVLICYKVFYAEDIGDDHKNVMYMYPNSICLSGKGDVNLDHLSEYGTVNNGISSSMKEAIAAFKLEHKNEEEQAEPEEDIPHWE